jgi:hypothetical protein
MTLQMEIDDSAEMEFTYVSSLVSGQNIYDLDNTGQSFQLRAVRFHRHLWHVFKTLGKGLTVQVSVVQFLVSSNVGACRLAAIMQLGNGQVGHVDLHHPS